MGKKMKITKRQLRRLIREALNTGASDLESAVKGKDVEIAMGGSGPALVVNGQDLDMVSTGLDYALEELWGDMGPEEAYDWFKSIARSVQIDPETAEDLGLWDHPDFAAESEADTSGFVGTSKYAEFA